MSNYSIFNVHGMVPQMRPSKIPFLHDSLHDGNHIFLALSETWLSEDHHLPSEEEISGYKVFRSDRVRKKAEDPSNSFNSRLIRKSNMEGALPDSQFCFYFISIK